MTISERLSDFVHGLSVKDIPPEVMEKAKSLVIDTIGIGLSSTTMEFGKAAIKLTNGWGGRSEASIIGSSLKTNAQNAAFCNGVLFHGQDYDDTHTGSVVHSTAALLPVMMAAGEQANAKGADALVALIAGTELAIRLGNIAPNQFHGNGYHTTSVTTTFASAAIAGKLYGHGRETLVNALGVSGSFVSGLIECVGAGADAKRLHAGWPAHSGIMAAQVAGIGYSGPRTVFEGNMGVYKSMLNNASVDFEEIFSGLGEMWNILDVRPKLYPCCHYLQAFIDCASEIRGNSDFDIRRIKSISCKVPEGAVRIVCEPWKKKQSPSNNYEARFSLPYSVAVMLVKGSAGPDDYSDSVISDPDIQALMHKISYQVDHARQVKDMPGYVSVLLDDGTNIVVDVPVVRGDREFPIEETEIKKKFLQNVSFMDGDAANALLDDILVLDELESLATLTRHMQFDELSSVK